MDSLPVWYFANEDCLSARAPKVNDHRGRNAVRSVETTRDYARVRATTRLRVDFATTFELGTPPTQR